MTKKFRYVCPHCGSTGVIFKPTRCLCGKLILKAKDNRIYVKSASKKPPYVEPCWVSEDGEILTLEDILEYRGEYVREQ